MKKEYFILAAIIIALSLYITLRNPDHTKYELPQLPEAEKAAITKIEINKQAGTTVLNRKDSKWFIEPEGYPADTDKTDRMLEAIEELSLTALVSESKAYERYDLTDDKKITVKAWAGDVLKREFTIGKIAPSFQHTFVMINNNDSVYQAQNNLRRTFDEPIDDLRDKTVLAFDVNAIQQITMTKGVNSFMIAKKQVPLETPQETAENQTADTETDNSEQAPLPVQTKTIWESPDGRQADAINASRLLSGISNLKCASYINDAKKEEFKNPIFTIQLKGAGDHTLSIFDKKAQTAAEYPAVSAENDYPFMIQEWQADNKIFKLFDDMLPSPDNKQK